jgi:hypothetical protein
MKRGWRRRQIEFVMDSPSQKNTYIGDGEVLNVDGGNSWFKA